MLGKFKTFSPTKERPEVGDAVQLIKERIAAGQLTTAGVFPPRFGKSDIIRAGAAELYAELGGTSVVLAHWRFLATQLLLEGKVEEMLRRLGMRQQFVASRLKPGDFTGRFFQQKPHRHLWAITTAAATQPGNLIALVEAAKLLRERGEGLRVFVDESHNVAATTAEGWGRVVGELEKAGAHIILLTGTPLRSDNIAPYGFTVEEFGRKAVEYRVPGVDDARNPIFRIYAAEKVGYRLRADIEVTRQDAWARGILTKIQTRWFGFNVDGHPVEQMNDQSLSRKAVSEAVRDATVIAHGVEMLVDDVLIRRHSAPTSAAMVYVGNDSADETKDARHTQQVVRIIEQIWQKKAGVAPHIIVAMLKDTDSAEAERRITAFVGGVKTPGVGDVLVVKQMGGVGLDPPRIKTCLDLSVVRTPSSCCQRWLRVCTFWEHNGKRLAFNATLILPKDETTVALHHHVVTQEGGDYQASENVTLLDEMPREEGEDPNDNFKIDDPHGAGVTNLNMDSIDAGTDDLVAALLRQQPKLALTYDRLELAQCLASGQFQVMPEQDQPDEDPADHPSYLNPDSEISGLKAHINDMTRRLADRQWDYGVYKDEWVTARRKHFNDARMFSGAAVGLPYLDDVDLLQRQVTFLQTRLAGG